MSTPKERIIELLNYKDINVSTFFPSINLSYSNFKGRQLKSSPSVDVLAKIKTIIPDVNIEWLVTGEGDMLQSQNSTVPNNFVEYLREKDKKIEELLQENIRLKIELSQARQLPKEPLVMPAGHSVTPPRISTSNPMK